jgi:hypothetical protein
MRDNLDCHVSRVVAARSAGLECSSNCNFELINASNLKAKPPDHRPILARFAARLVPWFGGQLLETPAIRPSFFERGFRQSLSKIWETAIEAYSRKRSVPQRQKTRTLAVYPLTTSLGLALLTTLLACRAEMRCWLGNPLLFKIMLFN